MKIIIHEKFNREIESWIYTIKYYGYFELKNKKYRKYDYDYHYKTKNKFEICIISGNKLIHWINNGIKINGMNEELQMMINIMDL